jgi:hypothetical protein
MANIPLRWCASGFCLVVSAAALVGASTAAGARGGGGGGGAFIRFSSGGAHFAAGSHFVSHSGGHAIISRPLNTNLVSRSQGIRGFFNWGGWGGYWPPGCYGGWSSNCGYASSATPVVIVAPPAPAPQPPQVIIIRDSPAAPALADPPPTGDCSYIPGCHAIPGGYHFDTVKSKS